MSTAVVITHQHNRTRYSWSCEWY